MNVQEKEWIDRSSYEELLQRWRFGAEGDPLFQGETGAYFSKVMDEKKAAIGPGEAVGASKNVGW